MASTTTTTTTARPELPPRAELIPLLARLIIDGGGCEVVTEKRVRRALEAHLGVAETSLDEPELKAVVKAAVNDVLSQGPENVVARMKEERKPAAVATKKRVSDVAGGAAADGDGDDDGAAKKKRRRFSKKEEEDDDDEADEDAGDEEEGDEQDEAEERKALDEIKRNGDADSGDEFQNDGRAAAAAKKKADKKRKDADAENAEDDDDEAFVKDDKSTSEKKRKTKKDPEDKKDKKETTVKKARKPRTDDQGNVVISDKDQKTIDNLKSYIIKAGIKNRNWNTKTVFASKTASERIEILRKMLADVGITGRPTNEICKKVKARLDLENEVKDLALEGVTDGTDAGGADAGFGRRPRRAVRDSWPPFGMKKNTKLGKSANDKDAEEEDSEDKEEEDDAYDDGMDEKVEKKRPETSKPVAIKSNAPRIFDSDDEE